MQPRGREVRVRPRGGLDVTLVQELLLDVRDLTGLDRRRHQGVVRTHLVVVGGILKLRLEGGQPLVDEVRLVVALQVVRLVVGGILVLHGRWVVSGNDVRPRKETGGRRGRRQNIGRSPAHGGQGQEGRAGGRNVGLPGSVAALVGGVGPAVAVRQRVGEVPRSWVAGEQPRQVEALSEALELGAEAGAQRGQAWILGPR